MLGSSLADITELMEDHMLAREEEMMFYESMVETLHKIIHDFGDRYHGTMDPETRKDAHNRAFWELNILKEYIASLHRIGLVSEGIQDSINRRIDESVFKINEHVEEWGKF